MWADNMDITSNIDEVLRRLPDEKKVKTASMRAINRAAQAGRTQATKEVRSEYIVKAKTVNSIAKVKKSNTSNLEANIKWSGEMLPIHEFKVTPKRQNNARKNRPQLRVQVSKKSGAATYKGAYVGTSGYVWKRKTQKRLPVRGILGPAVAFLINAEPVKERITKRTQEILEKRIEHEVNRMLAP